MRICKVKGCNNKYHCKGYCVRHYTQMYKYGKILERTIKDKNEIIDCGDYCEICLYNRQNQEIARAKIDKEDLKKVKEYKWGWDGHYVSNKGGCKSRLHQLILGKKGFGIDHFDHNTLDNRKNNLRHCTNQENCMNKKVKGYYWHKNMNKWCVSLMVKYRIVYTKYFVDKQDAIKARRQAEKKYFGEWAYNYK